MRFAILCMHFPLAQRRKPTTQSHFDTTTTMRFATLCMRFLLAQPRKPTSQSHLETTAAMRFATLCMHFALAQRGKPTTQSHLDTTTTMRFATLCMHFALAQRRKPTIQSHLDTTITMWFATLWMRFPLAQRRKPITQSHLDTTTSLHALPPGTAPQASHSKPPWHHHYNVICDSLNAFPPSTAPQTYHPKPLTPPLHCDLTTLCMHFPLAQRRKPPTQSHLDTTITMRFATLCMHFPLAQCRNFRTSFDNINIHIYIPQYNMHVLLVYIHLHVAIYILTVFFCFALSDLREFECRVGDQQAALASALLLAAVRWAAADLLELPDLAKAFREKNAKPANTFRKSPGCIDAEPQSRICRSSCSGLRKYLAPASFADVHSFSVSYCHQGRRFNQLVHWGSYCSAAAQSGSKIMTDNQRCCIDCPVLSQTWWDSPVSFPQSVESLEASNAPCMIWKQKDMLDMITALVHLTAASHAHSCVESGQNHFEETIDWLNNFPNLCILNEPLVVPVLVPAKQDSLRFALVLVANSRYSVSFILI